METLYGLKRKTTNRWLKLLLLLFVAVGFGVPNLNAQTKSIKVANNQQLIEAMGNPSIGTIVLEAGYYEYLNYYAESGTKVKKSGGGGNRDELCTYLIIGANACFLPENPGDFVPSIAQANTSDPTFCGCCPPANSGVWTVISYPSFTAQLNFLGTPGNYFMPFEVNEVGKYILRYTWASTDSHVETEYYFYGTNTVELSAPDVCGTSTLVDFTLGSVFPDPSTTVVWTLNGAPYAGPDATSQFLLEVDPCGVYELCVIVTPAYCPADTVCITIDFACEPIADAGPDVNVCDDLCYYSLIGSYGDVLLSPTDSLSWVQLSGPPGGELIFDDPLDLVTGVCATDTIDNCPYGEFKVEFQVQNGECYDSDTMLIRFYEQPEANAGPDTSFCAELCFSLAAVPYDYCGVAGVNYWSHAWWELVSSPFNSEVTFDALNPSANVCVIGDTCAYGTYVFVWNELNVKVVAGDTLWSENHCFGSDTVSITLFEQPIADAGDDVYVCVDIAYSPYCYSMVGTMDYCYTMHGIWTKSCGPGDVVLTDINDPTTDICFPAPGRYQFVWTLSNDMCEDADTVLFDLLETPTASAEFTEDIAACNELCFSLVDLGITKYVYTGVDGVLNPDVECPNFWDMAHWFYVSGPCIDSAEVTFANDTDPATELCVSYYGAYTIGWVELNKPADKDYYCSDTVLIHLEFFETPVPFAGDDTTICGNCYTLMGVPYTYLPLCNQHGADSLYWTALPNDPVTGFNPCTIIFSDTTEAVTTVCISEDILCYGTYGFVLHEFNGPCFGSDTVYITFVQEPEPVAICYTNINDCTMPDGYPIFNREFLVSGCIQPNDTIEVCSGDCTDFNVDCIESCLPGFDWLNPAYFGWTFEWTVTAPNGTTVHSIPGYYDFDINDWVYPSLQICWGECCDYARIYLTITTPACELTIVYYVYVAHKPCVNIEGPDVSDVGTVTQYCNVCPDVIDSCLLYNWTAEHCGIIQSGQGTECIDVLWTDYNINGGWGQITLTVFDICTGCCNYDEMPVKIWPSGTIGDATLAGHVYYHNDGTTPLDGVEIQLWNSGIPVQTTTSFNDIEGGNGAGYFEFSGINGTTNFGVTASYDAPWYGANATDALAVQLKVINALPGGFIFDNVVFAAMDVNKSNTISATDALWIKQRAISMVSYFPAGDWVFEPTMSASAASTPYDIYTLNAGDANRSNIPNSMKTTPAIDLITDGTMNVVTGQVFELPIRIADASQFGAITLDLGYNSALIEVVDVIPVEGMLDNVSDGNVSIAWSSVNPMILAENGVVVTLKVKALSPITSVESLFSIGLNSEFADAGASVIEPVTLKTYGVTTGPAATDYFLSANRPNPFSNSTFIEYTMPESGKVRLSVLDMLGQEMAVLVDATQGAGSYQVEFSAAGLSTGVYIYKITVDGETRDFISTQRMVISH